MRQLRAVAGFELRLFLREPVATFFTVVFPLLLLLTVGSAFGDIAIDRGRFNYVDVYVPALLAMTVANLGLMSIPIVVSSYRERGFLKALRATPAPPLTLVAGQAVAFAAVAAVTCVLVILTAMAVFGLQFSGEPVAITAFVLLGGAAFFAAGHAVAAAAKTPRTCHAVGAALFFVMLFLSGVAIPRQQFPQWMDRLGGLLPLAQVADPLVNIWTGGSVAGQWPHALYLVLLTGATVLAAGRLTEAEG